MESQQFQSYHILDYPLRYFCNTLIFNCISLQHANNIIHRDLKAENIFYSGMMIKIGDFGFSTVSKIGACLNTFCGSPPYAAPELFKDEHYEGRFVDIWAIGILIYFMVTGVMPFRADTVGKLKKCIIEGNFTIPSFVADSCQYLIKNLLKRPPKERLSLEEIGKSDWLEGQEVPEPLHKFDMMPYQALTSSGADEKEAVDILHDLGVTEKVIRDHKDRGIKSCVTGIYRIVLHRVQKQKYAQLSDGSISPLENSRSSLNKKSAANKDQSNDKGKKPQSKFCVIL